MTPSAPIFTQQTWMLSIVAVVGDARDGVHQQRLAEGRAAPRLALQVDRRGHVHERERHELGEAAGLFLQVPGDARCGGPS